MLVIVRVFRILFFDNEVKMFLKGILVNGKLFISFELAFRIVSNKICLGF